MTGKLIIITSPSGGGKGTLIKEVRAAMPQLGFSVSHTTRAMRAGEEHGREYFFIDSDEFDRMAAAGDFLEYAQVHGNFYGTSIREAQKAIETGEDLIVEIDVQGALQIMERLSDQVVSIFIMPPSFDVLESRLTARGTESGEDLHRRLRNAFVEVQQYEKFQYVVINHNIPDASGAIASIIQAQRHTPDRQSSAIKDILNSFDASAHRFNGE